MIARKRTTLIAIFLVDRLLLADGFGFFPSSGMSGIFLVKECKMIIPRARGPPLASHASASSCGNDKRGTGDDEDVDDAEDDGFATSSMTTATLSRRRLFGRTVSSAAAGASYLLATFVSPPFASARVISGPTSTSPSAAVAASVSSSSSSSFAERRDALLAAISAESNDDVIARAIEDIVPFGPFLKSSSSSSSYESALDGSWKLLWYNKSDFSPLLKLPYPLRPDSYQYFGSFAENEVGAGRAAQGLVGGVVGAAFGKNAELWLSSGVVSSASSPSTLVIYPPFRLQLGTIPGRGSTEDRGAGVGGEKRTIVESESDADFRKVNARSVEAQVAPRNEYEQLYLEEFGTGSLRVSVIIKGDPVIVGDMFVHQKL